MAARKSGRVHHFLSSHSDEPLPLDRVRSRLSAYVYGNVLTLAAVVVATPERIEDGNAAWVVFGTGLTTFLAHNFAELISQSVTFDGEPDEAARRELLHDLRDAVPILSSATVPTVALAMGWLGWLPSVWALAIAGAVPTLRIAATPLVTSRIRGNGITPGVLFAGLAAGALALLIVAAKILAH